MCHRGALNDPLKLFSSPNKYGYNFINNTIMKINRYIFLNYKYLIEVGFILRPKKSHAC